MLESLKHHLDVAQNRMKKQANKERREVEYDVGDLVFLKLRPYRQKSIVHRRNEKLAPRFFGPYKILDRVGPVGLELPNEATIHNVFHVSQLKAIIGEACQPTQLYPP